MKIIFIILSIMLAIAFGVSLSVNIEREKTITNQSRQMREQATKIQEFRADITDKDREIENQSQFISKLAIEIKALRDKVEEQRIRYNTLSEDYTKLTSRYDSIFRQAQQVSEELESIKFEPGKDIPFKLSSSGRFDCDDSAIWMYLYFRSMNYNTTIVSGNLNMVGEGALQRNHYWVWLHYNGKIYPYDWGRYRSDSQHYEGWEESYKSVLMAAVIG